MARILWLTGILEPGRQTIAVQGRLQVQFAASGGQPRDHGGRGGGGVVVFLGGRSEGRGLWTERLMVGFEVQRQALAMKRSS